MPKGRQNIENKIISTKTVTLRKQEDLNNLNEKLNLQNLIFDETWCGDDWDFCNDDFRMIHNMVKINKRKLRISILL